jgi:hypothetical protein
MIFRLTTILIQASSPFTFLSPFINFRVGENEFPAPSSTPFPSTDDLVTLVNGGDTEVIEPASVPLPSSIPSTSSNSKQRSYPGLPSSTSAREAGFPPPVKEPGLGTSTGTRPRRSASLSDALSRTLFLCFISCSCNEVGT